MMAFRTTEYIFGKGTLCNEFLNSHMLYKVRYITTVIFLNLNIIFIFFFLQNMQTDS